MIFLTPQKPVTVAVEVIEIIVSNDKMIRPSLYVTHCHHSIASKAGSSTSFSSADSNALSLRLICIALCRRVA